MNKFEYKVTNHIVDNSFEEEEYLNSMGEQGWELVAVNVEIFIGNIYYFKRKKL